MGQHGIVGTERSLCVLQCREGHEVAVPDEYKGSKPTAPRPASMEIPDPSVELERALAELIEARQRLEAAEDELEVARDGAHLALRRLGRSCSMRARRSRTSCFGGCIGSIPICMWRSWPRRSGCRTTRSVAMRDLGSGRRRVSGAARR